MSSAGESGPEHRSGADAGGNDGVGLVRRTVELLRPVAAAGTTITYRQLSEQLGPDAVDGAEGRPDLVAVLREASLSEEASGRGLLSAVVVRPSGRPGGGWYRLAEQVGRDVSDPEAAWAAERRRLRAAYGDAVTGAG